MSLSAICARVLATVATTAALILHQNDRSRSTFIPNSSSCAKFRRIFVRDAIQLFGVTVGVEINFAVSAAAGPHRMRTTQYLLAIDPVADSAPFQFSTDNRALGNYKLFDLVWFGFSFQIQTPSPSPPASLFQLIGHRERRCVINPIANNI